MKRTVSGSVTEGRHSRATVALALMLSVTAFGEQWRGTIPVLAGIPPLKATALFPGLEETASRELQNAG